MEYKRLIVSLRTPGRGIVIEGPSGIGKTTSVEKALETLSFGDKALKLSARIEEHRELIKLLPEMSKIGVVIIDDFHRLDEKTKGQIADYMKTLADTEDKSSKIVVVGINKAGDSLVNFARDLNNRIDTIRFEVNSEDRVLELVRKGEEALSISINTKDDIVKEACGSFHLAQMLCHNICLTADVTEKCDKFTNIEVSIEVVREKVLDELGRAFFGLARKFATGPKLRREGRAPYLHMLYWLANSEEWSLQMDQVLPQYPDHKGSVGQVIDKGFLVNFLNQHPEFNDVLHYDAQTRVLSAEDPKFVYYIRKLLWSKFALQVGYLSLEFKSAYDFALSFAGTDRKVAALLCEKLCANEVAVFYDKNEQHRILAKNVEEYLGPIYRSEARYVLVLLGKEYPKRIWTKFESDQFKSRFGEGGIVPIWFTDVPPGIFDTTNQIGGITFDHSGDIDKQTDDIVNILIKKLSEDRVTQMPSEEPLF
jgi:hypothetical protein